MGGEPPEVGDGPVRLADILDHGWLELFYQPKIELKTKRLRTGEAARCRDPAPMAPATIHVAGVHGGCCGAFGTASCKPALAGASRGAHYANPPARITRHHA